LKVDSDSRSPEGVIADIGWEASSFASSLHHSKSFGSSKGAVT
jgi:hypothetical protein